jgi:hypothetical protein
MGGRGRPRTNTTCAELGCGEPAKAKGLCSTHYNLQLKKTHMNQGVTCSHPDGCLSPVFAQKLCQRHYMKIYRMFGK